MSVTLRCAWVMKLLCSLGGFSLRNVFRAREACFAVFLLVLMRSWLSSHHLPPLIACIVFGGAHIKMTGSHAQFTG